MINKVLLRSAFIKEIDELNNILKRAISLWQYNSKQLELIYQDIKLSATFFNHSIIYNAIIDNQIVGFMGVAPKVSGAHETNETKLFILPEYIKQGIGSALWNKQVDVLKKMGLVHLTFSVIDSAIEFYERKGALIIKERKSRTIEGGTVPIMRVYF